MRTVLVLAALAALLIVGTALAAAPEDDVRCHGRKAEIVGTDGNDVIRGTPERDVIAGGKGDDVIFGSLGNDLICGGPGTDQLHGGRGNDEVYGDAGDEDQVSGALGDDKVVGGPGARDEVAGDLGIDIVNGGPGDEDLVHGDYGYDRMSGGAGSGDIASFATARAGGKGSGVWASLRTHRSRGDGHDKLFGFESLEGSAFRDTLIGSPQANVIDGGLGDDHLVGGGGPDAIDGGQGTDGCEGAKGRTTSCGKEPAPKGSAYIQLNQTPGGGAGLQIVGGGGRDQFVVAFDEATQTFGITAKKGLAIGPGCSHAPASALTVSCPANGPGRWLMADLGPGADSLRVEGTLESIGSVRFAGGFGNDTIKAGPEDDLVESGPGADKLYGGDGADGLVGGLPGPTFLYGEGSGDLLAAGGGCAGGALVGGPGRDDASFAETQAHPGVLIVSFLAHAAWVTTVKGCNHVHLSPTDEDMEGSFDWDVLIGDSGPNAMLGQPGADRFYGMGGDDIIDARDGVKDFSIQCGRGEPPRQIKVKGKNGKPQVKETQGTGQPAGRAITDSFDPSPYNCAFVKYGTPVPGLNG
ncbi:MAG TPA: calcium-binding protein [Solirubrobacterales bacterium]|jgi:Ca2+-binding RTX toxin-like protein|nr:calcium-binding protein [Solirubrobacterales bacterium]